MKHQKISLLLVSFVLLLSIFPVGMVSALDDKEMREVYLHASGETPTATVNSSTAYLGDTVNVYFAVDNPNKGDYVGGEHLEPQYDMNGYTVKIYFDPLYFDYAAEDSAKPIDYTVPDKNITNDDNTSVEVGDEDVDNVPESVGYYTFSHGSGSEVVNGKTYKTAYATIFFSGTYLPQKQDGDLWYNICALPLTPLRTGSSDVFIAVDSTDPYSLELFAKNVSDDYSPTFAYTTVNGGYHNIVIKDKLKPSAPTADPLSGSYTDTQSVTLEAEEGCEIFYSTDGGTTYLPYTGPIEVERSTEIRCYAVRSSDGKVSNTVTYTYRIIPKSPSLFIENESGEKELIQNIYSDDQPFTVYASDSETFGPIADDSEIYYTFS